MVLAPAAFSVVLTLALIGVVHLYWAIGGQTGKAGAIPSLDGRAVITPSRAATVAVAIILFVLAFIVAGAAGILAAPLPIQWLKIVAGLAALVFLARAIGDFRLLGLFKRAGDDPFAWRDTHVYSPLCLVLFALLMVVTFG